MSNIRAVDVAAYILQEQGPMPALKLQKLVYYSQAWSLVWDDKPLFEEEIEAWANGPVIRNLYEQHRRQFMVHSFSVGNPECLGEVERETVDAVLEFYADESAVWLRDLTHMEDPWKNAREEANLVGGERGQAKISKASMAEYYSSI